MGAGTDARCFLTMYGAKEASSKLRLHHDNFSGFKRNKKETFHFKVGAPRRR